MIYLEMFLIMTIAVFVTDLSGITATLNRVYSRWLFGRAVDEMILPQILRCSLCQTWWLCLAWAVVTSSLSLPAIAFAALMAAVAELAGVTFTFLVDVVKGVQNRVINWLFR